MFIRKEEEIYTEEDWRQILELREQIKKQKKKIANQKKELKRLNQKLNNFKQINNVDMLMNTSKGVLNWKALDCIEFKGGK